MRPPAGRFAAPPRAARRPRARGAATAGLRVADFTPLRGRDWGRQLRSQATSFGNFVRSARKCRWLTSFLPRHQGMLDPTQTRHLQFATIKLLFACWSFTSSVSNRKCLREHSRTERARILDCMPQSVRVQSRTFKCLMHCADARHSYLDLHSSWEIWNLGQVRSSLRRLLHLVPSPRPRFRVWW